MQAVSVLKKISLLLKTSGDNGIVLQPNPVPYSFIYGASGRGLTPFEITLNGMKPAETVAMNIARHELQETCGHLLPSLRHSLDISIFPQILTLEITIDSVTDCSQREIVAAMSAAVGGGCGGGSCDCGCS